MNDHAEEIQDDEIIHGEIDDDDIPFSAETLRAANQREQREIAEADYPAVLGGPNPESYGADAMEQFDADYRAYATSGKLADGLPQPYSLY